MRVIDQRVELLTHTPYPLELIEEAGRTCYKSESKGEPGVFVRRLVDMGHHSVIEHASATFRIITNRGVTHEIVRHRLASYSQESTRYCNYGGDHVEFIRSHKCSPAVLGTWEPEVVARLAYIEEVADDEYVWLNSLYGAEWDYLTLLDSGWKPEDARGVLPNDLKTEIVWTANMREWRHVCKLRGSKAAHPQMREVAHMILEELYDRWPELFQDIYMETWPHIGG